MGQFSSAGSVKVQRLRCLSHRNLYFPAGVEHGAGSQRSRLRPSKFDVLQFVLAASYCLFCPRQVIGTASVVSYYCCLIALALHYLVSSCQTVLPWTVCHPHLAQPGLTCLPAGSEHNATNRSQSSTQRANILNQT